jgi:hypothetical protein
MLTNLPQVSEFLETSIFNVKNVIQIIYYHIQAVEIVKVHKSYILYA